MRIPVFGGVSGTGLLKDLKVYVTLKQSTATDALKLLFPGSTTDAAGNIVITQGAGSGTTNAASQVIQRVELDSPTLTVILGVVAVTIVSLVVFLWIALRKH